MKVSLPISKLFALDKKLCIWIFTWTIYELFRLHANYLQENTSKQLFYMFLGLLPFYVCFHVFKKIMVCCQNVCQSQPCLTQGFMYVCFYIYHICTYLNRCYYFLELFYVHSIIELKVQRFPVNLLLPYIHNFSLYQHSPPDWYIYYNWWIYINTSLSPKAYSLH